MFSGYQEREDYENELYRDEADSGLSDVDSELEFRLYSQLHYSAGSPVVQEDSVQSSEPQAQPQQNSLPPSTPVDVIVIDSSTDDSSTDAVTASDNTEEDESVCAQKGVASKPCRKWQPYSSALLGPSRVKTRPDSPDEIVVLDSESDLSSDSHSIPPFVADQDSDSDGLENWMILGQEKQDGDQNIELNLFIQDNCEKQEYANDGGEGPNWIVSEKDKQAQIYNKGVGLRRLSNRYYTEKSVTCRNCNKIGHLSKNCPTPKKVPCCSLCGVRGHLSRTCPNRHCSNCSLPGHTYNDCLERAYWHKRCHRCDMIGHFIDACPEIWRQYHLTTTKGPLTESSDPNAYKTPAYCYNCARIGHFGYECNQKRMFNGTYPTLPFISYYDKIQDIRCRDQRLKRKARELWSAGPTVPPNGGAVSQTPEPPRKKQKTNHNQTNNTHTPKRRIAHTPKHHPQPPKHDTPSNSRQDPKTQSHRAKTTPQSAFIPQEQAQKKTKKKKKKKKKKTNAGGVVLDEDADFPRGCDKRPQTEGIFRSPWTANKNTDTLFVSGKNSNKKKENPTKKKEGKWKKRQKNAAKDASTRPDDDLFRIKQKQRRK